LMLVAAVHGQTSKSVASEFVKWRDVVVLCSKPVPSSIRSFELMYN
jgi:hypothetical protein